MMVTSKTTNSINMKNAIRIITTGILLALLGCNGQSNIKLNDWQSENPVLRCDMLVEDSVSHTFNLTISADSVGEASVMFYLIDCNDTLMVGRGSSVNFSGIAPIEDGYDVVMCVEWADTVITRRKHVTGFIHRPEIAEPMSAEELQQLINNQDKSIRRGTDRHLAQLLKLEIVGAKRCPQKLSDVIECISLGEWKSVIVTDVEYDEHNRISTITLKPVGEKPLPVIDSEEDEEFVIYDD